jgi:hypothetical protein
VAVVSFRALLELPYEQLGNTVNALHTKLSTHLRELLLLYNAVVVLADMQVPAARTAEIWARQPNTPLTPPPQYLVNPSFPVFAKQQFAIASWRSYLSLQPSAAEHADGSLRLASGAAASSFGECVLPASRIYFRNPNFCATLASELLPALFTELNHPNLTVFGPQFEFHHSNGGAAPLLNPSWRYYEAEAAFGYAAQALADRGFSAVFYCARESEIGALSSLLLGTDRRVQQQQKLSLESLPNRFRNEALLVGSDSLVRINVLYIVLHEIVALERVRDPALQVDDPVGNFALMLLLQRQECCEPCPNLGLDFSILFSTYLGLHQSVAPHLLENGFLVNARALELLLTTAVGTLPPPIQKHVRERWCKLSACTLSWLLQYYRESAASASPLLLDPFMRTDDGPVFGFVARPAGDEYDQQAEFTEQPQPQLLRWFREQLFSAPLHSTELQCTSFSLKNA